MNEIAQKLFDDYAKILKTKLEVVGVKLDPSKTSSEDIVLAYYTWEKKLISKAPRKVHVSKELKCPKHLESEFKEIICHFEKGSDMSGYLSRNLNESQRHDHLLYDWGIHHLHFYDYRKTQKRSSELLFIIVKQDTVFIIDIKTHNSFSDSDLLEILDSNWSFITDKFWMKGIFTATNEISDKDRKRLRKRGINSPTKLRNEKLLMSMMLGGGISTSGDSTSAVIQLNNTMNSLMDIGEYLSEKYSSNDKYILPTLTINQKFELVILENSSKITSLIKLHNEVQEMINQRLHQNIYTGKS